MAASLTVNRSVSSRLLSSRQVVISYQGIRNLRGNTVCLSKDIRDIKRFYKNVTIGATEGGFQIKLDARQLKSHNGQPIIVPNQLLAVAVATEWAVQGRKVLAHNMPLTVMCHSALDAPNSNNLQSRVKHLLEYLSTDTICIRANAPSDLVAMQNQRWDPLIDWMNMRYKIQLTCSNEFSGAPHPPEAMKVVQDEIKNLDSWSLTGLSFLVESLKSVVIALAVINRHITISEAVDLSRLEENYQTSKWGKVEWAHDLEASALKSKAAAATIFYQCSQNSSIMD